MKISSKEVKTQSKVANFESNLSKNQTTKDRVNPDSENVKKSEKSATGSGTTIERVTPNFSVKKVDVNQDLLLSEDDESDDDQILSPTKSFKGKNSIFTKFMISNFKPPQILEQLWEPKVDYKDFRTTRDQNSTNCH